MAKRYFFYRAGKKYEADTIVVCRMKAIAVLNKTTIRHKRITIYDSTKLKDWNEGEVGTVCEEYLDKYIWEPYDEDPRWLRADGSTGKRVYDF